MTDLERVQQDVRELRYVKEQTLEICLAAVQQWGWALRFVKDQTLEICLAAVQQNGRALRYVDVKLKDEVRAAMH